MKKLLIVVFTFAVSLCAVAEENSATVTTEFDILVEDAKGAQLRPKSREIFDMIQARQFDAAEKEAVKLRGLYEALFDSGVKQYTFQTSDELEEFRKSSDEEFEWIDWGYKECLQMQAFVASERRDFASAITILESIEAVAPISAGTAVEAGYVLNQIGKTEEALKAYRRAQDISLKYASQRPFLAAALRGIGYTLIDLNRLDEAEQAFLDSLEIDPGNELAKSELAYIRRMRGSK